MAVVGRGAVEKPELVDEMLSHLKAEYVDRDPGSEVANFYANRSVFITGATGFIGKALVEKLVRSCSGIKRIYLLIRERRGKDVKERLADLIESQIFNKIRSEPGGRQLLEEKLCPVNGDITLSGFGITEAAVMDQLKQEVSIVFNSAASIRFSEPIEVAARNNISSTGFLVDFCEQLPHLQALIHLSTAYSNCHKRDTIYEIIYEPPMRAAQLAQTIESLKRAQTGVLECPKLAVVSAESTGSGSAGEQQQQQLERSACLQQTFYPDAAGSGPGKPVVDLVEEFTELALRRANRPNVYTLTKAIAESHLLELLQQRPHHFLGPDKVAVSIVRPSIVGGSWREPEVGLVDNFNGPTGAIVALYTGALQAMPGSGERVADLVPVDMVVNMVLAAGWYIVRGKEKEKKEVGVKRDCDLYVFNMVSGYRNPLRWGQVTECIAELANKYPSSKLVRLPASFFVAAGPRFNLYDLLNHWLPARLSDFSSALFGLLKGGSLMKPDNAGPDKAKGSSGSSSSGGSRKQQSSLAGYTRIRQMTDTLTPFTSNEWRLSDANVVALNGSLSRADQRLFPFDVAHLDWSSYIRNYVIGSRIYALRDEPRNLAPAQRRLNRLRRQMRLSGASVLILLLAYFYFLFGPALPFLSTGSDSNNNNNKWLVAAGGE